MSPSFSTPFPRRRAFAAAAAATAAVLLIAAVERPIYVYEVADTSVIRLLGTSTVTDWTFESRQVSGDTTVPLPAAVIEQLFLRMKAGERPDLDAIRDAYSAGIVWKGQLTVPVVSLKTDSEARRRDMQRALKIDRFPLIFCTLTNVVEIEYHAVLTNALDIGASGYLEIAGQQRPVDVPFSAERIGEQLYRIRGETGILMSDFGITPPTALWGLIKAHDAVRVAFDLQYDLSRGTRVSGG